MTIHDGDEIRIRMGNAHGARIIRGVEHHDWIVVEVLKGLHPLFQIDMPIEQAGKMFTHGDTAIGEASWCVDTFKRRARARKGKKR